MAAKTQVCPPQNEQKSLEPTISFRSCHLCDAMCGLRIETAGREIISIKGDPKDPYSQGYTCPDVEKLLHQKETKNAVHQPLLKEGDHWTPISWKRAYRIAAKRLNHIRTTHGNNAIATHVGHPSLNNYGAGLAIPLLLNALNTQNRFSSLSEEYLSRRLANLKVFGHQALFPIPDIDHTDYLLCIGSNLVLPGSEALSLPNAATKLEAIKARGGRVIVIDPVKNQTAELASEHYPINPGTDTYLLLALVKEVLRLEAVDLGELTPYCIGTDVIRNLVEPFTIETVGSLTGIAAKEIQQIARSLIQTNAAIYGGRGLTTQQFGSTNAWLIHVLNTLTGNLDKPGGVLFAEPAIDLFNFASKPQHTGQFDRRRTLVSKHPEFSGEFPVSALADEILGREEPAIRALINISGNPIATTLNGKQLSEALSQLDFIVSIDNQINETSQHADLILPPTDAFEQSQYNLLLHHWTTRNFAKYSPPLYPPEKDSATEGPQPDWYILLSLSKKLADRSIVNNAKKQAAYQLLERFGIERFIDCSLRVGRYGQVWDFTDRIESTLSNNPLSKKPYRLVKRVMNRLPLPLALKSEPSNTTTHEPEKSERSLSLEYLKAHPHGLDLGPLKPSLIKKLSNGKQPFIDLAPKTFQRQVNKISASLLGTSHQNSEADCTGKKRTKQRTYRLISRRRNPTNPIQRNSNDLHQTEDSSASYYAIMNEKDAKRHQVTNGGLIRMSTTHGHIDIPVETSDKILTGVISVPENWVQSDLSLSDKSPNHDLYSIIRDQITDDITCLTTFNGARVSIKKSPTTAKNSG